MMNEGLFSTGLRGASELSHEIARAPTLRKVCDKFQLSLENNKFGLPSLLHPISLTLFLAKSISQTVILHNRLLLTKACCFVGEKKVGSVRGCMDEVTPMYSRLPTTIRRVLRKGNFSSAAFLCINSMKRWK